ncbi:MAG: hypothetical protein M3283_13050 [Actinomycetota bacterium]|nr:hypothetical protein [Actinomycetota bacterium]
MTEEGYSIPPPKFLVEELSPEGRELLDQMLVVQLSPEEAVGAMMEALPKDRALLWKINEYLRQAYEVEVEHNVEGYRQSQLAQSVFRRASVLEAASVGDDTTLEEAIRVLERHGEQPPEDLDLDRIEEVPVKDEDE